MQIKDYLTIYLQNRPFFLALLRAKELELFSRYLPFDGQILDVGSGDGFFAKTLFGPVKIDIGLDLVDSRQKESKTLNVYKKLVTYDGHKFPFKAQKFRTIVSNCVFEHIPNIDEIIGEIYRVMAKGGRLITTVMAAPWDRNLLGAAIFGKPYSDWMRKRQVHYNLFTDQKWDELFISKGFKITKKIGYLDERASRLIDLGHYLSIPSLISYKLTGRWVFWTNLIKYYPLNYLTQVISPDVPPKEASAIFYVLTK